MHEHEHGEQRFDGAAQAAEWDARYRERDGAMWSGRPNGRLVAEVADLTPGRALDVGCGEGADAIWLAQQRLDGHGDRRLRCRRRPGAGGRRAGRRHGRVGLRGRPADAVPGRARSTSCRCSTRRCPRPPARRAVRTLLDSGAPGRVAARRLPRPRRRAPRAHEVAGLRPGGLRRCRRPRRLLGDDFTVELHTVEPRIDPPPGTPHIADVVLRARRR